jgi:hypothetical protein
LCRFNLPSNTEDEQISSSEEVDKPMHGSVNKKRKRAMDDEYVDVDMVSSEEEEEILRSKKRAARV